MIPSMTWSSTENLAMARNSLDPGDFSSARIVGGLKANAACSNARRRMDWILSFNLWTQGAFGISVRSRSVARVRAMRFWSLSEFSSRFLIRNRFHCRRGGNRSTVSGGAGISTSELICL